MKKTGKVIAIAILLLTSTNFLAGAAWSNDNKDAGTDSYQLNGKDEDGMELDIRLCGCRAIRDTSGAWTGKICGCTVLDLSKGDFLLVGSAVLGLVALSARKKH